MQKNGMKESKPMLEDEDVIVLWDFTMYTNSTIQVNNKNKISQKP